MFSCIVHTCTTLNVLVAKTKIRNMNWFIFLRSSIHLLPQSHHTSAHNSLTQRLLWCYLPITAYLSVTLLRVLAVYKIPTPLLFTPSLLSSIIPLILYYIAYLNKQNYLTRTIQPRTMAEAEMCADTTTLQVCCGYRPNRTRHTATAKRLSTRK